MVSGKVADGFVKIALQGLEQAKAQIMNLSAEATKGFAAATATITGLVKSADPVRWTIFTQKLEILSFHIGRIFIPLLQQAITWVDKLIDYFSKLTNEQREGILKWTKVGLVILGVGSAIGTVIGWITKAISIISSLYEAVMSIVEVVAKVTPLGKIVKLIALGFALFHEQGGRAGEVFGKLAEKALPVWEKFKEVVLQLWDIFKRFAGMVGGVVDGIFSALGGGILDAIEAAMPLIEKGLNAIKDILDAIGKALQWVMDTVKDAQAIYKVLSEKKLSELPGAVAQGVGRSLTDAGAGLAKKLNPFDFLDSTIDDVAGFVKDDVIGGKGDEEKMVAEREKLDRPGDGDFSGSTGSGGDYGGDDDKFRPLPQLQRVQMGGIEEAFKRNQQAAGFDPTKIAANERRKWQTTNEELLRAIASGVAPGALPSASETF